MKNMEIKVPVPVKNLGHVRGILREHHAYTERQSDYYFNVPEGRLKLRISQEETSLIFYERKETFPKISRYHLFRMTGERTHLDKEKAYDLLNVLEMSLGVKIKVIKNREVYFIDKTKIHIDEVMGLGDNFLEIEVRDDNDTRSEEDLRKEFDLWMDRLKLDESKAINCSYSDMLMELE